MKLLDLFWGTGTKRRLLELEINTERILYRQALLSRPCNPHECEHHRQNISKLGSKYLKLTGKPYEIPLGEYESERVLERIAQGNSSTHYIRGRMARV